MTTMSEELNDIATRVQVTIQDESIRESLMSILRTSATELERVTAENASLRSQLQVAKASISEAAHALVDVSDRLRRGVS
jgi:hypothetical protein